MIAAGKGRRHRFTSGQLAIAGLAMVLVVGCKSAPAPVVAGPPPGAAAKAGIPSGMDTPIVISGGSIHFRARKSDWETCDGSSTTCYKAAFDRKLKATLTNYELVDEKFEGVSVPVTSAATVTTGWEIDVVDSNPNPPPPVPPAPPQPMQHGVLVCAESSSPFTACNLNNGFSSDYIYVIAVGGTLELKGRPNATNPNRLVFHDSMRKKDYAYISNIFVNASGGKGGQQQPCGDSACILYLSR